MLVLWLECSYFLSDWLRKGRGFIARVLFIIVVPAPVLVLRFHRPRDSICPIWRGLLVFSSGHRSCGLANRVRRLQLGACGRIRGNLVCRYRIARLGWTLHVSRSSRVTSCAGDASSPLNRTRASRIGRNIAGRVLRRLSASMVSARSLITPLNIVSNQCLNVPLLVSHAVKSCDDISVVICVEPKVILFPCTLVVSCCVFRPILAHYFPPR